MASSIFGLVYVVKSQFGYHNIFFMFHKSALIFNLLGNLCVLFHKKLVKTIRRRIRVHFSNSLRTAANAPETEIRKDTFHNKLTSLTEGRYPQSTSGNGNQKIS